jgi:hypothetical protein
MRQLLIFVLLAGTISSSGQSKSITRFRSDFKENTNMFFYSSTLKMLNTENNPELASMLKDIEEIRVLNYDKAAQKFNPDDISGLKSSLHEENYNDIMVLNEKGNSIHLYNREKHGKTVGFVAIVENKESLVLIDLIGSIDVKKFMELKQKLDNQTGNKT